jgi:hypothetical protein
MQGFPNCCKAPWGEVRSCNTCEDATTAINPFKCASIGSQSWCDDRKATYGLCKWQDGHCYNRPVGRQVLTAIPCSDKITNTMCYSYGDTDQSRKEFEAAYRKRWGDNYLPTEQNEFKPALPVWGLVLIGIGVLLIVALILWFVIFRKRNLRMPKLVFSEALDAFIPPGLDD